MGMEPQARSWGAAVLGLYVVPEDFVESVTKSSKRCEYDDRHRRMYGALMGGRATMRDCAL